jgi:hypothetical protein
MKKTIIMTCAAMLVAGSAYAQSAGNQSPTATKDNSSASEPEQGKSAPKTSGAMNDAAAGIATSPQDVAAQQQGKPTAADGGGKATPDKADQNKGPKTTGAAPGGDYR